MNCKCDDAKRYSDFFNQVIIEACALIKFQQKIPLNSKNIFRVKFVRYMKKARFIIVGMPNY